MLIGSHVKPDFRNGHTVREVPGFHKVYHFADNGDGHYLAEVKHPEDVLMFQSSPYFYVYEAINDPLLGDRTTDDSTGKARLNQDVQQLASRKAREEAEAGYSGDVLAEANELLGLHNTQIAAAIGKASSMTVIRAALKLEAERPSPRPSIVKMLTLAVEGAVAAGVGA